MGEFVRLGFKNFFEEMSQVLFFRNIYFGVAFVVVSLAFNSHIFLCGLFSALISYWYSKRNRTSKLLKDGGLLTINGFFFGIAMASLFHPSMQLYACLVIGAFAVPVATKATFEIMQHWKLSPFIISYILVVWVFSLSAHAFSFQVENHAESLGGATIFLSDSFQTTSLFHIVLSIFSSMGRLFFLPDATYGFAILVLISLFSPRQGIFFLAGTTIAALAATFLSVNAPGHVDYIQFSYSAGLVGLGLASRPEKFSVHTILLFCLLSLFLTLAADQLLRNLNLPVLSLPYVLTLWVAFLSQAPRMNVSWAR